MSVKKAISVSMVFLLLILTIGNANVITSNDTFNEDLVFTPFQYIEHNPIIIESDTDFIVQGWPGNGTEEAPYLIENLTISVGSSGKCIEMSDTTSHVLIRQCNFSTGTDISSEIAINLNNANNVVMEENLFFSFHAIDLRFSDGCEFRSNIMSRRGGIYLLKSNNCQIIENQFSSYKQDPNCAASVIDLNLSNNCTIKQNTISKCYSAIRIYYSNNTEVIANCIFDNEDSGIYCGRTFYALIFNNTIYSNEREGIRLSGCFDSIIYSNYIGGNTPNALDKSGASNLWDDNYSKGNFWDDYDGLGAYEIEGSTNSSDRTPTLWSVDLWGPEFVCPSFYNALYYTHVELAEGYTFGVMDSYLIAVTVTDISGVDCVQMIRLSNEDYDAEVTRIYTMNHTPLPDNPDRYTFNVSSKEHGVLYYFYFIANDTYGNNNITRRYVLYLRNIVPIPSGSTSSNSNNSEYLPTINLFMLSGVTGGVLGVLSVIVVYWLRKPSKATPYNPNSII